MKQNKKKKYARLLGILGALWLVIGCLIGCGGTEQPVASGTENTIAVSESPDVSETMDTTTVPGTEVSADTKEANDTEQAIDEETDEEEQETTAEPEQEKQPELSVEESGHYTGKDEVALYIHLYGHLPDNYITKREAENLGWNSKEGNLWEVAPNMSIGGSRFGNYEGALPDQGGRKYYECDIDFDGGYRGAKRIIYSDDGLIFYTEDHYNTFEQLYDK